MTRVARGSCFRDRPGASEASTGAAMYVLEDTTVAQAAAEWRDAQVRAAEAQDRLTGVIIAALNDGGERPGPAGHSRTAWSQHAPDRSTAPRRPKNTGRPRSPTPSLRPALPTHPQAISIA